MAASVVALESLLAARTLWHAGRGAAIAADGEPTGHAALDALLPQGGWPRRALTELLLPADGVGELSLLLPTLARITGEGGTVALVAPPYIPYAPAWQVAGVDLTALQVIEAAPRDALWAFEQCLRSGACAAVLGWPLQADAAALRRLQVAADSGACPASPCATANTRSMPRRRRCGWSACAMRAAPARGRCASAAAARPRRGPFFRAWREAAPCSGPVCCCRSWRSTPSFAAGLIRMHRWRWSAGRRSCAHCMR